MQIHHTPLFADALFVERLGGFSLVGQGCETPGSQKNGFLSGRQQTHFDYALKLIALCQKFDYAVIQGESR